MRTITGYRLKNSQSVEGDVDRANPFNQYYNRFDSVAFSTSAAAPSTPTTTAASTAQLYLHLNGNSHRQASSSA